MPAIVPAAILAASAANGQSAAVTEVPTTKSAGVDTAELERRIDVLAEEVERLRVGRAWVKPEQSLYGLGPAASKVYRSQPGLSIGGYGELEFVNENPGDAEIDLHRLVLYTGYKFDEHWVFNAEIEFEHINELSVEFAYVDYLHDPRFNVRVGHVLVPMGIMNELHEPTTYFQVERPELERQIIPSTWHENGGGIFGQLGPVAYKLYVINGFDARKFKPQSDGLRDLRQKGSEALINDPAGVLALDYLGIDGLRVGVSGYVGNSGQDKIRTAAGEKVDARTAIYEAHVDWWWRGLSVRAVAAQAWVDEAAKLNDALGFSDPASTVAQRMEGFYVVAGYDILSLFTVGQHSLTPWVGYSTIDTMADVPAGKVAGAARDRDLLEFGVVYKPIDLIAFKLDYAYVPSKSNGNNKLRAGLGFIF